MATDAPTDLCPICLDEDKPVSVFKHVGQLARLDCNTHNLCAECILE